MSIAIIIILLISLVLFKIFGIGDAFSPWTITAGIWVVLLFLLQLSTNLLFPLQDKFFTSLILWTSIFCISSIITYQLLLGAKPKHYRQMPAEEKVFSIQINPIFFNICFAIDIILTPLHFYIIWKVAASFELTNVMNNIRLYNIGGQGFGILNYSTIFSQVCLVTALCLYPNISKWKLSVVIAASLLSAITIMGKAPLIFILMSVIFVLYEKGKIKFRTIILWSIPIFMFFFIFTNLRQDQTDSSSQLSLLDFAGMYMLSPPVAFGYIEPNVNAQIGYSTFSQFFRFMNDWGMGHYEINPGIQQFVFVPIATNVYTIFQPFYEDFQFFGIAFFALLYGFFCGISYYYCKHGGGFAKCVYIYILNNLVLQFFQENILLSIVAFAEFCILVYLCTQQKYKITYVDQ